MISLDNLPGVAQVAIQGAKYAAKEIDGRLKGKPAQKPFKYFDKGSMAIDQPVPGGRDGRQAAAHRRSSPG